MARPAVSYDKLVEVSELNPGDKVKLTNGDIAEFVRLKQKNFVGMIDNKSYNIPVNMFVEIVGKVDVVARKNDKIELIKTLKEDELFYILHNGDAKLFHFVEFRNNKIVGRNPATNGRSKIDIEFYSGKVSEL